MAVDVTAIKAGLTKLDRLEHQYETSIQRFATRAAYLHDSDA